MEVVHIEQMATLRALEEAAHEAVAYANKAEHAETRDKVARVGIVLNMPNRLVVIMRGHLQLVLSVLLCPSVRVVEVVCSVAECVNFKAAKQIVRDLVEKPINYQATFNAALAVKDENYFSVILI